MILKTQIQTDFILAYKAKEIEKKDFLGVIKGAIQTQEGKLIPSSDDNVRKVLKSIEKGVNETIECLKKDGQSTEAQERELSYLAPYLPTLMSEDAIREIVKEIIPRATNKNIGFLMGTFNKENNGKAFDNKVVMKIINEELV